MNMIQELIKDLRLSQEVCQKLAGEFGILLLKEWFGGEAKAFGEAASKLEALLPLAIPPNEEDIEDTGLEPEEVTADAEGGNS